MILSFFDSKIEPCEISSLSKEVLAILTCVIIVLVTSEMVKGKSPPAESSYLCSLAMSTKPFDDRQIF